MPKKKMVNYYLPPNMIEFLRKEAFVQRTTMTQLVISAVRERYSDCPQFDDEDNTHG